MIRHFLKLSFYRSNQMKKCGCSSYSTRFSNLRDSLQKGPGLKEFITESPDYVDTSQPRIPYLVPGAQFGNNRKVFFDVFGCQMNVNDTDIVWSILKKEGFEMTVNEEEADIFLVMTCAIREGAENKIWHRLDHLRGFKRRRLASKNSNRPIKIGILGCMAERLKEELIEKEKAVDIVAGPDSYRDLPRLLAVTDSGQTAINVLLSLDETYADVEPVRLNQNSVSAFVSVTRGCDNMCTYCVVPRTRGRERSRPADAVLREVRALSMAGVRDVTLLGQNVNSYRDITITATTEQTRLAEGFTTVYKNKKGGLRFAELLDQVASVDPEMRIRFTAAHPKDFPDEVLSVVRNHHNVCKLLHAPAQHGNAAVLTRMRRGYSPTAYLQLLQRARLLVPGVCFSTDMICGFCGETEEEFQESISLMEMVDYHIAFIFMYSMREKTTAHRRYKDDVPEHIKKERHNRLLQIYRRKCQVLNDAEVGTIHLVLVEGEDKKGQMYGRNEVYIKVTFDQREIRTEDGGKTSIKPGDYVAVEIRSAKSSSLSGTALYHTGLQAFYRQRSWSDRFERISS